MKVFLSYTVDSGSDDPATAIGVVITSIPYTTTRQLYASIGGGEIFYQDSRKCGCGSHYFRNNTDEPLKVSCCWCGKRLDVQ
jgi:hypothetical protein